MRTLAREVAFKKIYEDLFIENQDDMDKFYEIDNLVGEDDKLFAKTLVKLYNEHKQEVAAKIDCLLVDYEPSRVYKIDRAIMSLATVEMFYYKETPLAVVINEAVNIAKKYGTDKSFAFVNGMLKNISKDI